MSKGLREIVARVQARAWAKLAPDAATSGARLRDAVRATRGLVLAEALILIMAGFSVDALGVLRVPGFAAGLAAALLVLAFGGLVQGRRLARSLRDADEPARRAHLARHRARGRAAAVAVVVLFTVWLSVFSSGVPPWAA